MFLSLETTPSALISSLKTCRTSRDLEKGKLLHSQAVETGFISNDSVCSCLIRMYSRCGCLDSAVAVFEKSKRRKASRTVLIQEALNHGEVQLALNLFDAPDCVPDAKLFVVALKACSSSRCLKRGKLIHSQIAASCCCDLFVKNSLIDMYGKCRHMILARLVFDDIACPDVISWTSLLHGYVENRQSKWALELFFAHGQSFAPNRGTFVAALMACGRIVAESESDRLKLLQTAAYLHDRAAQCSCCDVFVEAALIDAFSRLGEMSRARLVFDRAKHYQSVVCWNSLLHGYVANGESLLALQLFHSMSSSNPRVLPNARSFVAAISACGTLASESKPRKVKPVDLLERLKSIQAAAVRSSCCDEFVETSLIDSFAKCESMVLARKVFDRMPRRNSACWTALICGYTQNGDSELALKLFHSMASSLRDSKSFAAGLAACARLGAADREKNQTKSSNFLREVQSIHSEAVLRGCCDSFLETALTHAYAACGHLQLARDVFTRMANKTQVPWNTLIQGCVDNGENQEALHLFASMDLSGITSDSITFAAALAACANSNSLDRGKLIHEEARSLETTPLVATSLISLYSKCGRMDLAHQSFHKLEERWRDCCAWNALISGHSHQGDAARVLELVEEMRSREIHPDATTFTYILSACSHAGLTTECVRHFNSMASEYGITPEISHCNCVVDLLARSNCPDEAYEFMARMPVEPNLVTWTTLLPTSDELKNEKLINSHMKEYQPLLGARV